LSELIEISGVLLSPGGEPVPSAQIVVISNRTSTTTLENQDVTVTTDENGEYAFSLVPGGYTVTVRYLNRTPVVLGRINVQAGSEPGSINDYLLNADEFYNDKIVYNELKRFSNDALVASTLLVSTTEQIDTATEKIATVAEQTSEIQEEVRNVATEINQAAASTEQAAAAATAAATSAELVVYPSESDPDGIATGLSMTVSGQSFRVVFGDTGNVSAIVYVNDNGIAQQVSTVAGSGIVRRVNETILHASKTDPYFAVADQFGRIGQGLMAWYEDGEFGTSLARVSNSGLNTEFLALKVRDAADAFTDTHGRARLLKFSTGSTTVAYDDSVTVTETDAVELWVLGGSDWKTGRISGLELTGQGAQITRQNCVEMKPVTGAVTAPVTELAVHSLAFVVQVPRMPDVNTSIMLYSFTSSSTAAGVRCWFRLRDDGALTLSAVRYDDNSPMVGTILPPNITEGDFIFVAHIMKLDNDGENYQVLYVGGQPFKKLREFDTVTRTFSTRNIGLGNAYYSSSGWTGTSTVIAEFSAFDYALSETETVDLFHRANIRMNMRGISLAK